MYRDRRYYTYITVGNENGSILSPIMLLNTDSFEDSFALVQGLIEADQWMGEHSLVERIHTYDVEKDREVIVWEWDVNGGELKRYD